ncbi:MAG: GIDE domain-containing protein [Candidatus Aenigmatarchaeota archaeon]
MVQHIIVALVVGIFAFYIGIRSVNKKRLIQNIPTSKIRSLAMGLVEIYGEVLPAYKKLLVSPFSGEKCVYYGYKIQEYRSSGKTSSWVTVAKEEEHQSFFLKDETGHVLVDSRKAEIELKNKGEFDSSWGKDPPLRVKEFLKSKNMSFEGFLGINKRMRYYEYVIKPRDKVYIMGTAGKNPHIESATAKMNQEGVMIQKANGNPYYISDQSEKKITRNLTYTAWFSLIFGGLFILGAVVWTAMAMGVWV